jgi:ABC-type sugar transport system permease subunit
MTAITALRGVRLPRVLDAPSWLRVLLGWRVVHTLATVAGGVALFGATAGLGRSAALGLTAVALVLNLVAITGLLRRRSSGRSWSLAVDYLTFVGCLVLLLQANRVFVGLDALGDTFVRGVPFVLVALVAYIATGYGDGAGASAVVRRVARLVMILALVAALVAVGLLPGVATFLARTLQPLQLTYVTVGLLSGFVAWRTFQSDVAYELGVTSGHQRTLDGLLFVSPNVLGFAAFFAGPLLFSLFVSATEWDAFGEPVFVGLRNYIEIAQDALFWRSIRNIVLFSAMALPLSVIPALLLASMLNSKAPGIRFFRAVYFVPFIAGVVAISLMWRQLMNSTVGWLNYIISSAVRFWNGLPLLPELTDPRVQWLSDADIALFSLVIVFAWQYLGYNAILFLAGLQGVDHTLHEAAMLDGANRWQRFRNITLPALRPTTFFVVASMGIFTLQLFSENVVLFPTTTPIGAGPQNSTLTPVVYLYEQGFRRFAFGYASAVAWVLFVLIFAFTFVQFRRQRDEIGG